MGDWSSAEAAHRAASDAELIAWVDEQDCLLGALPRAELRSYALGLGFAHCEAGPLVRSSYHAHEHVASG